MTIPTAWATRPVTDNGSIFSRRSLSFTGIPSSQGFTQPQELCIQRRIDQQTLRLDQTPAWTNRRIRLKLQSQQTVRVWLSPARADSSAGTSEGWTRTRTRPLSWRWPNASPGDNQITFLRHNLAEPLGNRKRERCDFFFHCFVEATPDLFELWQPAMPPTPVRVVVPQPPASVARFSPSAKPRSNSL